MIETGRFFKRRVNNLRNGAKKTGIFFLTNMEEHEINAIVFVGFMLTVMSCTAMILYVRTTCMIDPVALREILKARRELSGRQYRAQVMQDNSADDEDQDLTRRYFNLFRVKKFTTQYEMQQDENEREVFM